MKKNSVLLRAFEPDDYILINKWRNDFEVQRNVAGRFRYVSEAREKKWVEYQIDNNTTDIYLAICNNNESKEMIGYTSINDIDYINRKAEWGGIVMAGDNHNSKQLTDAILLIFDYAFVDMSLHRLTGAFLDYHKNAFYMNQMMGLKIEGVEKESVFKNQEYHDLYKVAILHNEYFDLLNSGGYEDRAIRARLLQITKEQKNK